MSMSHQPAITFAALLCATMFFSTAASASPPVGAPAPDFELPDQKGDLRQLADYSGQWLVLYFYPRDDTPGCTTQACEFRDNIFAFRRLGAVIVGISVDDVDSHEAFAAKHSLPFTLLADVGGGTARSYGVLRQFGDLELASRQTFLISPEGIVARHYDKVDVNTHSAEVLKDIQMLIGGG